MANKKRCPNCKKYNRPSDGLLINNRLYCDANCATEYGKKNRLKGTAIREKEERKEIKKAKEKLKSRADYTKEAQAAVNAYIRIRDKNKPCISCGRFHQGQWHAGHYKTAGAHPELRFNTFNIYKQCAPCNNHLSGNILEYRKNLVRLKGTKFVEWLEGKHDSKKYSIEDLKRIKKLFARKKRLYENKFR
jgi:hypothetical protein